MSTAPETSQRPRHAPAARTTAPAGGPGRRRGDWTAAGLFLLAEALLLAVVRLWQPRFFYIDDKAAQYLPVWHWLGGEPGARLPAIDPDQGSAGNFVGDLQYGVLDPFHWGLATVISRMDGLNAAGWGLHVLAVTVLGLGIVALARHYGAGVVWSAAAAVGAANSGFLFWFASSWWPAAWGTAVLPWLWWALVTRSRAGLLTAALAGYLVATSGYPYSLPFAGLIVVAVGLEKALHDRSVRTLWSSAYLLRALAAGGGLLMAAPGLLAASAMTPYTQRATLPVGDLGSTGEFIPNLLDVIIGGPTLNAQVTGWWGDLLPSASMAAAWFVLPVLALVDRQRVRALGGLRGVPGVTTGLVLAGCALLATQLPTVVGGLRYPFRYAVVLQVVLPLVVAVLASRAGLRFSRGQVLLAVSLLVGQAVLATARTPDLVVWHVAAALAGIAVVLGLRALHRRRSAQQAPTAVGPAPAEEEGTGRRVGVAAVVLLATALAPLVSIGAAIAVGDEFAAERGGQPSGRPANALYEAVVWPADVAGFRAAAVEPGLNASVLHWGSSGFDRGLSAGVPLGSAALFSDIRPGYGYTSVGQGGWAERLCQDYLGQSATCPDAAQRLLATVPGTDRTWLDATSKDVLLLDTDAPPEIYESLEDGWRRVGRDGDFDRFEREEPTEGRITVVGDAVTELDALAVGPEEERYAVSWTADGDRRLVTRSPWWPGYEATVDGQPLDVQVVDGTLLAVELPAEGGSGELVIGYVPPGLTAGLVAVAVGALGVVALAVLEDRRGRSRR